MDGPQISIIVPWVSLRDLEAMLDANQPSLIGCRAEILAVHCGDRTKSSNPLSQDSLLTRFIEIPGSAHNRALSINVGLHYSRAPFVLMSDCFCIWRPELLRQLCLLLGQDVYVTIEKLQLDETYFDWLEPAISRSKEDCFLRAFVRTMTLSMTWGDGSRIEIASSKDNPMEATRSGLELLAVNKRSLVRIDGFNSDLHSGWENVDLRIRLEKCAGLQHVESGEVMRVFAQTKNRPSNAMQQSAQVGFRVLCNSYLNGSYGGTYSKDISTWVAGTGSHQTSDSGD